MSADRETCKCRVLVIKLLSLNSKSTLLYALCLRLPPTGSTRGTREGEGISFLPFDGSSSVLPHDGPSPQEQHLIPVHSFIQN